jgi:hypothetical protein
MAEITDDQIASAATAPKEVDVDGQKIVNHPLGDVLKAAQYLAGLDTSGRTAIPIRVAKIRPDGAT